MTQINIHEAKARFSHYTRLVKAGETVILCDRNKPFAEIRPLPDLAKPAPKRELGLMKGMFPVPDDFNEPDPELEDLILNGPIFPPVQLASSQEKP